MTMNGVVLAFDATVLADQQLLQRAKFYDGTPNGYTDANFIRAVRKAREALGVAGSDTAVDAALRARLQRAIPTVETPDPVFPREGPRIVQAQSDLRDLGVYSGPANGTPNASFDEQLRAFQIRERLPSYPRSATPILDDVTLARLQLRAAEAKSRGTPPAPPPITPDPAGILATQELLARFGFYQGTPNGLADTLYTDAIKKARAAQNLPDAPDLREAREPLEQRLGVAQRELRDLGLYVGPVDGIPSKAFDAALRSFQNTEQLPTNPAAPTAVLDDATRARLDLRAAARGVQPPPAPGGMTPGGAMVPVPVGTPMPMGMPVGMSVAPMTVAAAPAATSSSLPIIAGVAGVVVGAALVAFYMQMQQAKAARR